MTIAPTAVYLVGAGPGDPELITQKAHRIIQLADVILYDYLVHPNLIMANDHAEKICVGKKKGRHSVTQTAINQRLVADARAGKCVVRLKGGDPMIFGRCAEEIDWLTAHQVPFEIIPGISSAIAAPTYAGIPVTHRDTAHSLAFVTATRAHDTPAPEWPSADTLVIMMGLYQLDYIVDTLTPLRGKDTPIAIIESGTTANQRVVTGTLQTIQAIQGTHKVQPPALVVVGDTIRHRMDWRHRLPLHNRRFVVTRAAHQQSKLANALHTLGAETLQLPLNTITTHPDALTSITPSAFSHLLFTSQNGVCGFFESIRHTHGDIRQWAHTRIGVVGTQTQNALQDYGITPDHIATHPSAEGFTAFLDTISPHDRVLVPSSSESDRVLETTHSDRVTYVTVYTNTVPSIPPMALEWIHPADTFIVMNAASVHRLHAVYPAFSAHTIMSIGPQTTRALCGYGAQDIHESTYPSIESIIEKILENL
jgi:uroporphyrinogen III methyltransferase/synthase